MKSLDQVIFYSIEKTIKMYRQFAQKSIKDAGFDITIDQWLVLKTIQEDATISQQQLAIKVFKDFASITRMIELLVKHGFLNRDFHQEDRRRFKLSLTEKGIQIIESLEPIISANRTKALVQISSVEVEQLQAILLKITTNIKSK
ncbi:MAG: MarR family transcriptional regulator [Saprospiraceae bacterium]|jgi:MarR family transcriptional regulator for hemolysin|nr:MarR family transcriptional regulator [Saprospiraceae bacterium]